MRYILTGTAKELENVLKENRIRIQRGLISITPVDDRVTDSKELQGGDSKELPEADAKHAENEKKSAPKAKGKKS